MNKGCTVDYILCYQIREQIEVTIEQHDITSEANVETNFSCPTTEEAEIKLDTAITVPVSGIRQINMTKHYLLFILTQNPVNDEIEVVHDPNPGAELVPDLGTESQAKQTG